MGEFKQFGVDDFFDKEIFVEPFEIELDLWLKRYLFGKLFDAAKSIYTLQTHGVFFDRNEIGLFVTDGILLSLQFGSGLGLASAGVAISWRWGVVIHWIWIGFIVMWCFELLLLLTWNQLRRIFWLLICLLSIFVSNEIIFLKTSSYKRSLFISILGDLFILSYPI